MANELPAEKPNLTDWSRSQDRGEDLAEERDPFIQPPERDTQSRQSSFSSAPIGCMNSAVRNRAMI